ncbi:hypothetical protein ACQCT3_02545 [Sutcliffiella horikoshii]|uniref:hypothetical protein n=1 Tax=Sutcliffiella horikoshii TaxID=79883 RepID=UPI003CEBAEC5
MELLLEDYYTDSNIDTYTFPLEDRYKIKAFKDRSLNELDLHIKIQQFPIETAVKYEWEIIYYFFDNGKIYGDSGYPILRHFNFEGESLLMDEEKGEKDDLKDKWIENYKLISKANENSKRTIFQTEDEMMEFIKNCEKLYNIDTKQHLINFPKNGFEGNVDERKWFRIARHLEDNGYNF